MSLSKIKALMIFDTEFNNWQSTYATMTATSGTWSTAYTTMTANSATWNYSDNSFWVGAAEMIPRTTNGAGINSSESTTNKVNYDTTEFDPATAQYVQFWRSWPRGWNTFTTKFVWTADSGSGDVVWACQARCYADDDPIDSTFGTALSCTDTLTLSADVDISPSTLAITPSGTVADGAPTVFQVYRNAPATADTLAVKSRLIGVIITKNT